MSTYTRQRNYDIPRPPLEFGTEINIQESDPTKMARRIGDATGMSVKTSVNPHVSDFDKFMPWLGMERVNLNGLGDELFRHGEDNIEGYPLFVESATSKICSRVPKFYTKVEFVTGELIRLWLSPQRLPGYRVHPAFQNAGAGETSCFYVGSYELPSTALSAPNLNPQTSKYMNQFRTIAQAAGTNWQFMDFTMWNALQWLWTIVYGPISMNSQDIFEGISHATGIQKTGYTSSYGPTGCDDMGNACGQVLIPGTDDYAFSAWGVENLFGNTATMLEGALVDTSAYLWLNYRWSPYSSSGPSTTYGYEKLNYPWPSGYDGYIETLHQSVYYPEIAWLLVPRVVEAGVAGTYYCDYCHATAFSAAHVLAVGGSAAQGDKCGIFSIDGSLGTTGTSATIGARLAFVPWDNTKYYVY